VGSDLVETPPGDLVESAKRRITATVPPEDTRRLTGDNAAFALDVLRQAAKDDNFFSSPYSMSIALAMTYGGARGDTEAQMGKALHFTMPQARLHATFGALDRTLASRAQKSVESGSAFKLNVLNNLWGQRGHEFLDTYLDLLAENYGAGLSLLDFAADPDGSRAKINRWVSDATESRIPELVPSSAVSRDTVLVLTNAIYFNASWSTPFDSKDTRDASFTKLDGSTKRAHFMHQAKEHRYAEGEGWQALELRYVGDDVSMLFILPSAGTFREFRDQLDEKKLAAIDDALGSRRVDLTIPKFSFRTELPVKPTLKALGMKDAFESALADFSGMDGTRNLFIQDVVHQAFVAVDEKGTEAAAATAVSVGRTSLPQLATFEANRPFFIIIRDRPTDALLFVGQVTSP
jgi:serpin B